MRIADSMSDILPECNAKLGPSPFIRSSLQAQKFPQKSKVNSFLSWTLVQH